MEQPPKRQGRLDHDVHGPSGQDEEAPLQLANHQETNSHHGTGIQSKGNFNVGGNVHISVSNHVTEQKGELEKQQEEEEKAKERLLESLAFAQMDARELAIQKAHTSTCRWILANHHYECWAQRQNDMSSNRFIWLKGKPGTGKSTMMKFLLGHIRDQLVSPMGNVVIIHFFFNARGADLEKTTLGMYRSLLLQLLKARPKARTVLNNISSTHEWTINSLETMLESAVQNLQRTTIICLIDALDECGTSQARDMVSFFNRLIQNHDHLYVCFASRHYPHISIATGLEIILEHQIEHQNDIEKYLSGTLQIGSGELARQIRFDILAKASGVFMWVVLVVGILNREFDAGRKHTLRKRLEQLPKDLHQLFRDILTRDTENVEGLLLCIQWILFARRPLTPHELYFAIISGLEPEYIEGCHLTHISMDDINKYILDNSKGLAEPTGRQHEVTVQFIHESVVDFLIKDHGLTMIFSDLGNQMYGKSHNSLKLCCLRYIEFMESAELMAPQLVRVFPLKSYAQKEIVYHADQAELGGIHQEDFVADLSVGKWIEARPDTIQSSLLYVFAERGAGSLIRAYPTGQSCFTIEQARYEMPIIAAAAHGMTKAALALLEMEVSRVPALSFTDLCNQLSSQLSSEDIHQAKVYSPQYHTGEDVFNQLLGFGPELAIIVFLRMFKPDVNLTDRYMQTPIFHAIKRNHYTLLKHLIDMGANLSYRDTSGAFPVHLATKAGSSEALAVLVNCGCDVDVRDTTGQTPLHYSVIKHIRMMNFILQYGVDVNAKDDDGLTPLHHVFEPEKIDLLVRHGAYVDARDQKGRTPLHAALTVITFAFAAAKRLLSHGAKISVADDQDQTPFNYALWHFRDVAHKIREAIRLFQEHGADISAVDGRGETLLHWSLRLKLNLCVRELVNCGADISKPDRNGYTPIWWAVYAFPPDVDSIQLLISRGSNIHDPDQDGYTLLHRAVEQDKLDVAMVLVKNGASRTTVNKHGQSPLDLAFSLGFDGIGHAISRHTTR